MGITDPIDKDRRLFEFILVVLINEEFSLERIIELDWEQFCTVRSWDVRMNAWYIARSHRALSIGRQIYPKTEEPSAVPQNAEGNQNGSHRKP